MKNSRIKNGILRIVQGIIIGAGAILPGISGGVLAVVFGIYRPAMELLTHPRRALQRYWRMLLAVGIGWAIGFLGGGSVILALFHQSETVATCLFIGSSSARCPTSGTRRARRARQRFVHLADRQLPRPVRRADGRQVQFICRDARKLLGLSLLRRAVGLQLHHPGDDVVVHPDGGRLLTPLIDGIAQLDFTVLIPWGLGMVA